MIQIKRADVYAYVIPVAVALLTIIATKFLISHSFTVWPGDATAIWDIAQKPLSPDNVWWWGNIPYTYRVLIPTLVYYAFHSSLYGFVFIGVLSLLLSNILIYRISRLFTEDIFVNSFCVIAFSTNYTVIATLANSAMLDLPSFVILLSIVLLILSCRKNPGQQNEAVTWILFSALILTGTLIKEWILLLIPLFFIFFLLGRDYRTSFLVLLGSLPGIVAHAVIRYTMGPFFNSMQTFDPMYLIGLYTKMELGVFRQFYSSFGAVWLLMFFAVVYGIRKKELRYELVLLPVLGLVTGLIMSSMAAEENRYLFFTIFPFVIPLLSVYLAELNKNIRPPIILILLSLFGIFRIATMYRPFFIEGSYTPFSYMTETPGFLTFLMVINCLQVAVVLIYVLVGSGYFGFLNSNTSNTG